MSDSETPLPITQHQIAKVIAFLPALWHNLANLIPFCLERDKSALAGSFSEFGVVTAKQKPNDRYPSGAVFLKPAVCKKTGSRPIARYKSGRKSPHLAERQHSVL
jgi:hypothetical protein